MTEKEYSSFNSSIALNMDINRQDKKDISKLFAFLRAKLNAKEKELLELQRAEPCLLAPDFTQIDILVDAISSLHLSTQDGSFMFASKSDCDNISSSSTSVCSTGVDTIKTLPSNVWLSQTTAINENEQQKNQYRLPMVTHLLSLPVNAYVASSSNHTTIPTIESKEEPSNRLPVVSQLLSMPINAFKSSSNIQSTNEPKSIEIEDKKEPINTHNKVSSRIESTKSILNTETIYSKENWLKKPSESESDFVTLDLEAYLEQTNDKMRRLHMEYLEALEKLKTPSNSVDSSQMIKSIYPQMFNRVKQDIPTKNFTHLPSNK